ncbi:hypothetical protein KM777_09470 [Vibrio splendidus]|nr:hypothetical protein [Vibrio splendidus]
MKLLIDLSAILRVNNTTVRSGKGNGISLLFVLLATIGLDKGWNQNEQTYSNQLSDQLGYVDPRSGSGSGCRA